MKWITAVFLLLLPLDHLSAETKEEEAARYLNTMMSAIREGNDPMRNRMFIRLRYLGTPSVGPMLEALDDESADARLYLAFTLGFLDDPRVVDPLISLFQSDPEVSVRSSAAEALGRLQCTEAVDLLIGALSDSSDQIRQSAAYSLGRIGDPRAQPALEKAMTDDENELVRYFSEDALEQIERAMARKKRS